MPAKTKNRWELVQMKDGISSSLEQETNKLNDMYIDSTSKVEDRQAQASIVADLTERLKGISGQIDAYDREVSERNVNTDTGISETVKAQAALIRSAMSGKEITSDVRAALKDDTTTGGGNLLPTTLTTQLITEPKSKNPLRNICQVKNITGLKMPKISYTLADDDFIEDGETAKEMTSTSSVVQFGRYEYKVFSEVTDTILNGTDTNLVEDVNASLLAGIAKKEKKVAFADSPKSGEEHMSFYSSENAIKTVEGANLFIAIKSAIADLEDDYVDNATVVMSRADYYSILETLANGNASLYAAQPESVLGVPVVFCDSATKPVVGDFSYAVYNYEQGATFDRDKDVKTGVNCFVVTCLFDFRILMSSAFRIAEVASV